MLYFDNQDLTVLLSTLYNLDTLPKVPWEISFSNFSFGGMRKDEGVSVMLHFFNHLLIVVLETPYFDAISVMD